MQSYNDSIPVKEIILKFSVCIACAISYVFVMSVCLENTDESDCLAPLSRSKSVYSIGYLFAA
jgi:hypothetical protein